MQFLLITVLAVLVSHGEARSLATCEKPDEYYDCSGKKASDLAFGTCSAALQCIANEGNRRFLRDVVGRELGKNDGCWPSNPNCCDFGFDYGLKVDESKCKADGKDFCLGSGFSGSVNIKCPTKKSVVWNGIMKFAGAFRKAGSTMYKSENGLFCKAENESANFASSGTVSGSAHDTSHFDLCWYAGGGSDPTLVPPPPSGGSPSGGSTPPPPPPPSDDCYDPDVTPMSCTNDPSYICDQMNGRTYYMMSMTPSGGGGNDCSMKCVAQSDVDHLMSLGYLCGRCGADPRNGDLDLGDDEDEDEAEEDEDMCPEEL